MPLMTSNQQIKCHLEKKTSGWKCPTSLPRAARCTDLTLQGRGAAQPRPLSAAIPGDIQAGTSHRHVACCRRESLQQAPVFCEGPGDLRAPSPAP